MSVALLAPAPEVERGCEEGVGAGRELGDRSAQVQPPAFAALVVEGGLDRRGGRLRALSAAFEVGQHQRPDVADEQTPRVLEVLPPLGGLPGVAGQRDREGDGLGQLRAGLGGAGTGAAFGQGEDLLGQVRLQFPALAGHLLVLLPQGMVLGRQELHLLAGGVEVAS